MILIFFIIRNKHFIFNKILEKFNHLNKSILDNLDENKYLSKWRREPTKNWKTRKINFNEKISNLAVGNENEINLKFAKNVTDIDLNQEDY